MIAKQLIRTFPVLLILLVLAACAPPSIPQETPTSAPSSPTPTSSVQATDTPTPISTPTPQPTTAAESLMPKATLSPELQTVADKATAILAETLDVKPEEVTILQVRRVEWRNASLGCPQPGMMYAQVITPGYLVRAEVNGEIQTVHMNDQGRGVVCPPNRARDPYSADQ